MVEICQEFLPILPWADPKTARLPGLNPVEPGQWLQIDDAYSAQMTHRLFLMREHGGITHRLSEMALPAAEELLNEVLVELTGLEGFDVAHNTVICPDDRVVEIDRSQPLLTLGALVQEDFVIMQKQGAEHGVRYQACTYPQFCEFLSMVS